MQEILINKDNTNTKIIALVENGILLEKYEEAENQNRLEGNIYLGKVQNVLQGMQAAFINIGENRNAFIHLKDIIPKLNTKMELKRTSPKNIKEVVRPGMPIMVQVKRDASSKKGGRVSTHISLSGRYVVLMPDTDIITISQKIEDTEEEERLLELVKQFLPKDCGAIIRTAAEGKEKEELKADIEQMVEKWKEIKKEAKKNLNTIPRILYKSYSLTEKMLLDIIDRNIEQITTNDEEIQEEVEQILNNMNLKNKIPVECIKRDTILDKYRIDTQLERLKNSKIWLNCGGFITIDKTEALTAIDVNTGKYTGSKDLEKTILTVNKEATIEISKQLRLRDIGGIVIIDYINMSKKEDKEIVKNLLIENLKKDRSKTQVCGFTNLNLLEMTRKHICSN